MAEEPLDGTNQDSGTGESTPEDQTLEEDSAQEEPAPALPTGTITITSEPSNAKIYLMNKEDNRFRLIGTTPHTTEDLAVGDWEFRAEKSGLIGRSKVFRVKEGSQRSLAFALAPVQAPSSDPGYFKVVVVPFGNAFLDGDLVVEGKKVILVPAAPGVGHELRISHGPTLGSFVMSDKKVASGDTLNLGRKIFSVGGLKVGANTQAQLQLDGIEISGTLPLDAPRVLAGDHLLTIAKPGLIVEKAWLYGAGGKAELLPVNPGSPESGYPITIVKNQTLHIKFDLKSTNR